MSTHAVAPGLDVLPFVAELARAGEVWVQGVGHVEDAELAIPEGQTERVVAVPGRSALVSLSGPPTGMLFAVLAISEEGALRTLAGRLAAARSAGVTLLASRPGEAPAAGSPREPEEDDDEADEAPAFGDRVDHFVFGLCDVMVVTGERMKIRDLGAMGKLRELHLGAVRVHKPTVVDGKRVFRLARRT